MKRLLSSTTALSVALALTPPGPLVAQTLAADGKVIAIDGTTVLCDPATGAACDLATIQAETQAAAAAEAQAAVEAEAAATAQAAAEAEAAAAAQAAIEAEAAAAAQAAIEAEAAAAAQAAAEAEAVAAAQAAAEAEAVAAAQAAAEAEAVAAAEAAVEAEAAAAAQAAAEAEAAAAAQAVVEAEAAAAAQAAAEAEAEAAAQAAVEAEAAAAAQAATEAEAAAAAQAAAEAEAAAAAQAAAEAEAAAAAQAATEAEAAAQAAVEAEAAAAAQAAAEAEAVAAAQAAAEDAVTAADQAAAVDTPVPTETAVEGLTAALQDPAAASDTAEGATPTAEAAAAPAAAAAVAGDAPLDAAPPADVVVTTQTVTEAEARSSSEEFTAAPVAVGEGQKSGLSNLEKVGLVALGALVVGAVINESNKADRQEVVSNSGDRVVVQRPDGSLQIYKDDDAILRRPGSDVRTETYRDGSTRTIVDKADGTQIVTVRDASGRVLRRARYDSDGRELVLFDDLQPEQKIVISDLPRVPARQTTLSTADPNAALKARMAALQAQDIGRSFSLRQIREVPQVRALAATIDVDNITFDTGSSAIKVTEAEKLADLGGLITDLIKANPSEVFLIEGHTDAVGSAASNLALSDRRAESVALALSEYFGVPPENLVVQGYGEKELRIDTQGDERANRRVAVRVITPLMALAVR